MIDIAGEGLSPWYWLTIALALLILEVVVTGAFMLWLAFGAALAAGIFALFSLTLTTQVVIFSILSLAALGFGRPAMKRRWEKQFDVDTILNQKQKSLIGKTAILATPLHNGEGRIKLGDSEWGGRCDILSEAPAGLSVCVIAVEGTTLVVIPSPPASEPLPARENTHGTGDSNA